VRPPLEKWPKAGRERLIRDNKEARKEDCLANFRRTGAFLPIAVRKKSAAAIERRGPKKSSEDLG